MVLLLHVVIIFKAAVGWEYEGKTEKHESQLGMHNELTLPKIDHSSDWQGLKLTFYYTCKVLLKIFFHQQTGETTSKFFPFVWETWMILTRKRLLVDIFLTHRLSKSLAFCKFATINFEPCSQVKQYRYNTKQHRLTNKAWPCVTKFQELIIILI